ncbi:serine/threonine-protein kinase Kist-like isoform X2 [Arvicanthis niloticus]|uniref:serine/threonine-protein kinase Kist-like isoform X2 n=1 Tax=Arvicanthis niloticus TaxID=61156 RepID=UPI00402B6615
MAGSGCAWGAEPPRFLEAFGRLWQVQSRLGSGSSASVYRVRCCGTPGSPPGALKQFLPPGTTGAAASAAEYGFRKERAALEQLQGHRNIGLSTNSWRYKVDELTILGTEIEQRSQTSGKM